MSELKNIRASISQLARELYEDFKASAEAMPQWQPVSVVEFPHVDLAFYGAVTQFFVSVGFRTFGDFEDVTATRRYPDMRTPVRTFVSGDGAVTASAWHLRSLGKLRMQETLHDRATNLRAVAISSEFADGTFVVTCATKGHDRGIEIPGIVTQRLAPTAPQPSLLKLHLRAVAAHRSAPVPVHTQEQAIESGRRLQRLRAEHLRRIGYVDLPVESKRWRDYFTPDIAAMLVSEIAQLQATDAPERNVDGIE